MCSRVPVPHARLTPTPNRDTPSQAQSSRYKAPAARALLPVLVLVFAWRRGEGGDAGGQANTLTLALSPNRNMYWRVLVLRRITPVSLPYPACTTTPPPPPQNAARHCAGRFGRGRA